MTLPLALSETWYMFLLCVTIALAAWCVFVWAVRSGQFKDTEQTARDMLDLDARDEPAPAPPAAGDAPAAGAHPEGDKRAASGTLGGPAGQRGREPSGR